MRWLAILVLLLLPGCFTELLVSSNETTRNIACAVLAPETEVIIVHHGDPGLDLEAATQAWARALAAATGTETTRIRTEIADDLHEGIPDSNTWALWMDARPVLGDPIRIHVLWVPDIAHVGQTVDVIRPGFLAINTTAITEAVIDGHDGQHVAEGLLVHGLGHVLGVVNRGIPMHNPDIEGREEGGHEPNGIMSAAWHRTKDLPRNATTDRYSDVVAEDWNAATRDARVCP